MLGSVFPTIHVNNRSISARRQRVLTLEPGQEPRPSRILGCDPDARRHVGHAHTGVRGREQAPPVPLEDDARSRRGRRLGHLDEGEVTIRPSQGQGVAIAYDGEDVGVGLTARRRGGLHRRGGGSAAADAEMGAVAADVGVVDSGVPVGPSSQDS